MGEAKVLMNELDELAMAIVLWNRIGASEIDNAGDLPVFIEILGVPLNKFPYLAGYT